MRASARRHRSLNPPALERRAGLDGCRLDRSFEHGGRAPAGTFTGCLKVEETTPIESNALDHKIYAPGIGWVVDGEMRLVSYGPSSMRR